MTRQSSRRPARGSLHEFLAHGLALATVGVLEEHAIYQRLCLYGHSDELPARALRPGPARRAKDAASKRMGTLVDDLCADMAVTAGEGDSRPLIAELELEKARRIIALQVERGQNDFCSRRNPPPERDSPEFDKLVERCAVAATALYKPGRGSNAQVAKALNAGASRSAIGVSRECVRYAGAAYRRDIRIRKPGWDEMARELDWFTALVRLHEWISENGLLDGLSGAALAQELDDRLDLPDLLDRHTDWLAGDDPSILKEIHDALRKNHSPGVGSITQIAR